MGITEILGLAAYALDAIKSLTKSDVAGEAADVVRAIDQIFVAVDSATAGHVTPAAARAEIDKVLAELAANDAAADAALAKKFPEAGQ